MSEIKERPILFNGDMVRAILDGRKTVTRRAIKMPLGWEFGFGGKQGISLGTIQSGHPKRGKFGVFIRKEIHPGSGKFSHDLIASPFGQPGDRLWVRETCFINDYRDADVPEGERANCEIHYRADGIPDFEGEEALIRWRPSIHMPRWASRILLEVTGVRIERLQDITEEQAKSEGCYFTDYGRKCGHGAAGWSDVDECQAPEAHHPQREGWSWKPTASSDECLGSARGAFANLWNSTGGDWDANPWVWVVEFKRIQP